MGFSSPEKGKRYDILSWQKKANWGRKHHDGASWKFQIDLGI